MGEWTGCEGEGVGEQREGEHLHHCAAYQSGINFENVSTDQVTYIVKLELILNLTKFLQSYKLNPNVSEIKSLIYSLIDDSFSAT